MSNTFRHVRPEAWWVGVVLMTCPFASLYLLEVRRFYFSLLLAILTAAIAFLGAFLDARISLHFSSFTACASKGEIYPFKDIIYSVKSSDYLVAQSCFNSTEFIESDVTAYLTTTQGPVPSTSGAALPRVQSTKIRANALSTLVTIPLLLFPSR